MEPRFRPPYSGFAQITRYIDRAQFLELVQEHEHEKGAKGFSSWAQFSGMIFARLPGRDSLRSVENAFDSLQGELNHLGLPLNPISKSSLARANEHRPADLREDYSARVTSVIHP